MTLKTILLAASALAVLSASPGVAADFQLGGLTVSSPWARASAGMARAGAAFMIIHNTGADEVLVSASAQVSDKVELHTHVHEGGVMKMRAVPRIPLPAGQTTELKPGGRHVMFLGLKAPFKKGQTFPLTLSFKQAGSVTVPVEVGRAGAMGPMQHHMKHDMKHDPK